MPKIKVCGMRDKANIGELSKLMPDYLGFIFCEKSARYFYGQNSQNEIGTLPAGIQRVGVFCDSSLEFINDTILRQQLNALQFHGDESPEFCGYFKEKGFEVWKAISVSEVHDLQKADKYQNFVDAILFDTKTSKAGGSGLSFDWEILKTIDYPFILAGGLGLHNINEALASELPITTLDLNSRFELEPGLKNIESLKEAFNQIRQ